jgi:uncharacterized protein YpiB (UPF0302 family)
MKELITVSHKRNFIHWFLNHYEMKDPMVKWLLESLSSRENWLTNVHFTEHLQTDRKAMLISTKCVQMAPFKFYHMHRISTDVEKALLEIHQHPEQDLYVTLYFRNRLHAKEYKMVLEHPEFPLKEAPKQYLANLQIELFIDELLRSHRLNQLYQQINLALDHRDQKLFMKLSDEYLEIIKNKD